MKVMSKRFNPKKLFAIDTETSGLRHWHGDAAFAVGMCDEAGRTWYCQWPVDPFTRVVTPDADDVTFIRQFTEDSALQKIMHNSKFDYRMMAKAGIGVEGRIQDTHIAARVVNNLEFSYGLKDLAAKYCGITDADEKELADEVKRWRRKAQSYNLKAKKESQPLISLGRVYQEDYWLPRFYEPTNGFCQKYCELDVVRTRCLWEAYQSAFREDESLVRGYEEEMELWYALNDMEWRGMRVDPKRVQEELKKAREAVKYYHDAMVKTIRENRLQPWDSAKVTKKGVPVPVPTAYEFNPGSTPQLTRVLYLPEGKGGLGLVTSRTTKVGNQSTDKNTLRELMHEPFVRNLNAYRAAEQAISLFFEKYTDLMVPDQVSPGEMCLHPGINQVGTVTFRFSSSDPNLQQVSNPKSSRDQGGNYQVRGVFGPRKGYWMYAGDYAQQELRLFADIANIPFFLNEINAGRDPNNALANRAWGGKNNPSAIKAAAFAMDLGREAPSNELVAELWKEIEWNQKAAKEFGFSSQRSQALADEWLSRYNYEIVAAEKSLDRGNTRARGKCVMFAKIYGGGPGSITELIYCTVQEAKQFFNDIDRAVPEINGYMQALMRQARTDGFIVNPYGRKVRVESDFAYKAVNYMIQSTAAIMMKDSTLRCWKYFKRTGLDAHVLMTVHDELLFEVRKEHARKWLLRGIQEIMSDNQGRISVPMPVELKLVRSSWDQKETIDLD